MAKVLESMQMFTIRVIGNFENARRFGVFETITTTKKISSIVDSGTPLFTLPPKAFQSLRQVYLNNCSSSDLAGVCPVSQIWCSNHILLQLKEICNSMFRAK